MVDTKSAAVGLSSNHVEAVIGCESGWNPEARGDHNLARGLVQIRSDYHPDISAEEADNPVFAIDFLISEWKEGHENAWSCFRSLNAKYGTAEWPLTVPSPTKE